MEIDLKQIMKRPFSGVARKTSSSFWMLIPSISKAKRTYYGCSSAGTADYRHGADIRLLKQFKSNGYEVSKKKEHLCSEAKRSLVAR
jgi:hypothetical protein